MGVAASQSHDVGLLAWLRRWGKPARRTPGGWKDLQAPGANHLTSDVVAYVALHSRSGGALASEERQTPHAKAPGLLGRVMQLGRYKSSHKARYFDLIFNELHQCYSSRVVAVPGEHLPGQMQCQQALGTYKSGEQDVRQSLPSLGVQGKASRGEGKGAALPPVCLQVVLSELTPWECRTSLTRGKTGHIQTLGVEGC